MGLAAGDLNVYRMVYNNPVLMVDNNGLWTVQVGVSGTGGGAVGGTVGGGVVFSYSKENGFHIGGYTMEGGGSFIGGGGSLTIDISWSANACISDVGGAGLTVGGSGGEGLTFGGEATLPISGKNVANPKAMIYTASGGIGGGLPGEGHAFVTHTQVFQLL